jgi:hypothetical protein
MALILTGNTLVLQITQELASDKQNFTLLLQQVKDSITTLGYTNGTKL